jgi:hypothetical protein
MPSVAANLRYMRELNRRAARARSPEMSVMTALDFARGGQPSSAYVYNRQGIRLGSWARDQDEGFGAFRDRARTLASAIAGASRLVLGGLPDLDGVIGEPWPGPVPAFAIRLPDPMLHSSQLEALRLIQSHRRVVLRAGRRWGKSTLLTATAVSDTLAGKAVGLFSPTYKLMSPVFGAIARSLAGIPGAKVNHSSHEIRLPGGGGVNAWSLDHTGRAGRGHAFHRVLIDESAFGGDELVDTFDAAIVPSTIDFRGSIVEASTPNGIADDNHFWRVCNQPELGFVEFHARTVDNPHLPVDEVEALRKTMRPEVAAQELDAEFVDLAGVTIFPLASLLVDGEPHPDDGFTVDYVGLTIDSNSGKGGPDKDGVAAVVFAVTLPMVRRGIASVEGARVVLLDWSIESLAQGGVAPWIQHVRSLATAWFHRLQPLQGWPQAHVEPAGNAYSIIETARVQGLAPNEIDSKFVTLGKDNRALAVDPHTTCGRVKISRSALDKRTNYRGVVGNHLVRQVTGFRAFDKDAYKREDDLFDAAMYAVLVSLGDGREARWSKLKRAA